MGIYPTPSYSGVPRPRVYNWIGKSASVFYWDDPANWAEGIFPNHPEATVLFKDAIDRDTTILLRRDIQIANLWFSEKTFSYKIEAEGDPEASKITFMTGQQLANITLDEDNRATHEINSTILHSCKKLWGPGWRTVSPSPAPNPVPRNLSTLRLGGKIANYKEAPRASLNIDGYINVEIRGANEFIGPVVVNRGTLSVASSNSIPEGTVMLLYHPGCVVIEKGVVISVRRFSIDGRDLPSGSYDADAINDFRRAFGRGVYADSAVQGDGMVRVSC